MKKGAFTHDSVDNKTVDWWTPPHLFTSMGVTFDMDVAAPEGGVPWIPCRQYITAQQCGLRTPWKGFVWCNPPYGKHTEHWLRKMHRHGDGVALVFARTDTRWYHFYCRHATAILFLEGRLKFIDAQGKTGGAGASAV